MKWHWFPFARFTVRSHLTRVEIVEKLSLVTERPRLFSLTYKRQFEGRIFPGHFYISPTGFRVISVPLISGRFVSSDQGTTLHLVVRPQIYGVISMLIWNVIVFTADPETWSLLYFGIFTVLPNLAFVVSFNFIANRSIRNLEKIF